MVNIRTETEEYLEGALREYSDIKECDKKLVRQILMYYLNRSTDYEFREYDSIFEKAIDASEGGQ